MYIAFIVVHILACLALILIVLLQRGKGADLGAAFGGSSQTVFGSQGAGGFLARLTTVSAVVFMITCLSLAYMSSHRAQATIMERSRSETAAPAQTAAPAEEGAAQEAPDATAAGAPAGSDAPSQAAPPAAGGAAEAPAPAGAGGSGGTGD
ncbi:MAG: preprotein translocase subunit SecG [bacterium]